MEDGTEVFNLATATSACRPSAESGCLSKCSTIERRRGVLVGEFGIHSRNVSCGTTNTASVTTAEHEHDSRLAVHAAGGEEVDIRTAVLPV